MCVCVCARARERSVSCMNLLLTDETGGYIHGMQYSVNVLRTTNTSEVAK